MRAPSVLRRGSLGFNMTPMIDVVFQLIIFFLLSGQLVRQETDVRLKLPAAETSATIQPDEQIRRLVLNVLENGQILMGIDPIDKARLREVITFEKQKAGAGGLEVRIRADRQVEYKVVEPIMVACAQSGVWRVTFAVTDANEKK